MSPATPVAGPVIRPLDPALDEAAATILVAVVHERSLERARAAVAEARANPEAALYGLVEGEELCAVYVLAKRGMANDVAYLAVHPDYRRRGYGTMCLHDALLRSGRRPLTLQTLESELPFYKKVGFKVVARRKDEHGRVVFRLGWHAPLPKPGGGEMVC